MNIYLDLNVSIWIFVHYFKYFKFTGAPIYHFGNKQTNNALQDFKSMTLATPATPSVTTVSPNAFGQFQNGIYKLIWKNSDQSTYFEFSVHLDDANNAWAAFAFSNDQTMVNKYLEFYQTPKKITKQTNRGWKVLIILENNYTYSLFPSPFFLFLFICFNFGVMFIWLKNIFMLIVYLKTFNQTDDDVNMCLYNSANGTVKHYYNKDKNAPGLLLGSNPTIGYSNIVVSYNNGLLTCSFDRVKSISNVQNYFDLSNNYYLLLANGKTNGGGMNKYIIKILHNFSFFYINLKILF